MRKNYGPIYAGAPAVWLGLMFIVPLIIVVLFCFMSKSTYGGILWKPSLNAYRDLANPAFLRISLTTAMVSAVSTLFMVAMALPVAYCMARSRRKNVLLMIVMIPFWTNFLIRIYAWIAILGNNGILNHLLIAAGILDEHVQFLYNTKAVIIVTIYAYLPFAILPLYAAMEKFDFHLLDAARDLGASPFQAVSRVLLPNISAGIFTAVLFTFIPTFGSYAIPQIIGGRNSMMLGNVIARELTVTRNWPLACSISVILTLITGVGVIMLMNLQRRAANSVNSQSQNAGAAI
jgi:spermidine/putrescine transport system permease protein